MPKHQAEMREKTKSAARWIALALATSLIALPVVSYADDAVIWGRQSGLGKFTTKKVNLRANATITNVTYEGGGNGFCIWSGAPRASVVVCWNKGNASLNGYTLPANRGYFAIPAKRTANSPAYVQVTVSY